jgi:hypothetical protein
MTRAVAPLFLVALMAPGILAAPTQDKQPPKVAIPQSGVPEIMTIEGEFIRVAYNNEGYVVLGYRMANESLGEEWMLLEVGATMRDGKPNFKLTREAISLDTPAGKTIPLPTNAQYREADLRAVERRSQVMAERIDYFPPSARTACRIGFFAPVESAGMAYDQVELSYQRGCLGRLYFKIPGGIQYGQHWLNVKFPNTLVRVPFRIFTKEERKTLQKNYGDIRKQIQEAFKKKTD